MSLCSPSTGMIKRLMEPKDIGAYWCKFRLFKWVWNWKQSFS